MSVTGGVTQLDELHLTTDLADSYIASAVTWNGKQAALVSGTNIKTINGSSVLGSGDLVVSGSSSLAIGTTPITSGTIGRVLFQGTGNVLQQSTNLFWDNTNARLGIGTATPLSKLHIVADTNIVYQQASSTGFTGKLYYAFKSSGVSGEAMALFGEFLAGNAVAFAFSNSLGNTIFQIRNGGNVQIGTNPTDAGFKLDVNGTARVQNLLQVSQTITAQGAANLPTSGSGVYLYYNNNGGNIAATSNFASPTPTQLCIQPSGSKVALGTGGEAFANTNNNFRQRGGAEFALNGTTQSFDFYVNQTSGNVSLNLIRPSNTVGHGLLYRLQARNSANTIVDYSAIGTRIDTNTAGSHTGSLLMYTTNAGTLAERMRISPSGSLLINTTTEIASSKLTIDSTTQGFLPPRMTTTEKNAIATPAAGLVVYDTTLAKLCLYTTTWETITSI
jgi:hypothetical protein